MAHENDARWVELMAAAQNGDHRSYAQLLHEIVPVLVRVVRRQWPMGQATEVDDVVQETLKSLHSVRHTYDPARPFLPWLLAIARHRLADEIRRQKRTVLREVDIEAQDETSLGFATNSEYGGAAYGEALKRAIGRLP
ncbi:MAG: RNA polymerase subunit sigma-24, partial [Rhodospirillales bacterium]|nr:RNA polymerase subunit sigma-24 [Rhodospirillales bacterium]